MVFPGPNDLVVDVDSMFRLGEGGNIAFEALGVGPTTHHTNYFRDERVIGVLDIDAPVYARFDAEDRKGLEILAKLWLDASDI